MATSPFSKAQPWTEIAITFATPVTEFDETDIVVTGDTLSNFSCTGAQNTAIFTADADFEGAGKLEVLDGYQTQSGVPAERYLIEFQIDTLPPSVAVSLNSDSIDYDATSTMTPRR